MRTLKRRSEVDGAGKANELIWTQEVIDVSVKKLVRKCHVIKVEGEISQLADWGGSCDWFFYRGGDEVIADTEDGKRREADDSQTETTQEEPLSAPLVVEDSRKEILPAPVTIQFRNEDTPPSTSTLPSPTMTLTSQEQSTSSMSETAELPTMDIIPEDSKLRGLDLFCGGGNFGRGIADGGAVRHKWSPSIDLC